MSSINYNFPLKDQGASNSENTILLPRHRWYYYKEGFSPKLVENAFESAGVTKGDTIIDPFNGGGTTTLTAAMHGFNSVGFEVNPFTAFLAEAKVSSVEAKALQSVIASVIDGAARGGQSSLINFSTFSKKEKLEKWLFNTPILEAHQGGWDALSKISNSNIKNLCKLALLSTSMDNCNAVKDGKCLRYRDTWQNNGYGKETYLATLTNTFNNIISDIVSTQDVILGNHKIYNGDARELLSDNWKAPKFKLCVTSPPYLNTFDYTDIYRPELFLGKFVKNNAELYNLRLKTVRSHLQAKWQKPTTANFGALYSKAISEIVQNKDYLMHKDIPLMVQAYFEDMERVLRLLLTKAANDAQLWLVVSNSAYAGVEIPVDLILGEIGARVGWYLKEVGVLRYLKKRKTKHSGDITQLRESVVILSRSKK